MTGATGMWVEPMRKAKHAAGRVRMVAPLGRRAAALLGMARTVRHRPLVETAEDAGVCCCSYTISKIRHASRRRPTA